MAQVLVTESYISDIASAIRSKNGQSASYTPSQMASAIGSIISAGALSFISKSITSNGTYSAEGDNADAFSSVVVDVPNSYAIEDEGKVVSDGTLIAQGSMSVTSNSIYDTTLVSQVVVDIPSASISIISKTISENGTYNPSEDSADAYSQVVVNVAGGGGGGIPEAVITGETVALTIPTVSVLRNNVFRQHSGITGINMENVISIPDYCFYNCRNLETASFEKCTSIGTQAFADCSKLESLSFPSCTYIGNGAFSWCLSLKNVDFPNCSSISVNAFLQCEKLKNASFPNCSNIGAYAFSSCSSLETINIESCKIITSSAFYKCKKLESIYLPNCSSMGSDVFNGCALLSYAYLPEVKVIAYQCFNNCYSLKEVWLNKCSNVSGYAFYGCQNLESVYLLSTALATLANTNAFIYTPLSLSSYLGYFGSIYVPASLVDSYKAAQYWSVFSDRITSYVEE